MRLIHDVVSSAEASFDGNSVQRTFESGQARKRRLHVQEPPFDLMQIGRPVWFWISPASSLISRDRVWLMSALPPEDLYGASAGGRVGTNGRVKFESRQPSTSSRHLAADALAHWLAPFVVLA